jgi:acyl-CoA thioesterase
MEELMQYMNENDKFVKHNGIELTEVSPGYAKAKMEIKDFHFNSVGTVQGGAIFTLADLAFAAASNSHGRVAMGINVSVSYIKSPTTGTLYAEAREVSLGYKLGNYTVNITDGEGELVAVFQGAVYRKNANIMEK